MLRLVCSASLALVLPLAVLGQHASKSDTIPTSRFFELNYYFIQVPLGQTHVAAAPTPGKTIARYHFPDDKPRPICQIDTTPQQHLRTTISQVSNGSTYSQKSTMRGSANNSIVSYQMSGSMTIDDDPAKYVMDVVADPLAPMAMKLNLGYGSARLDLSTLRMMGLEVVAGAADVVLTYSKPNAVPMKYLTVTNGMAKIVIRNLDMARAEQVLVSNGLGETKIMVGPDMKSKSSVRIDVGTGKCTLLVHQAAPIKVIINGSVFSSAEIPEGYIPVSDNTFTSASYTLHANEAMTITVDLGIGSFELIPFE